MFARASEEMQCDFDGETDCEVAANVEYLYPTAEVTGISSSFDDVSNAIQVTITGTGLDTDCATTELLIDGVAQTCISAGATEAVFQVDSMVDKSSSNIRFYTEIGTTLGASTIVSHDFDPALVSVSPNSGGSSGGEKITVTGVGFGTDSTGVNLYHEESAQDICQSVEVTAYGTFTCYTIA